MRVEQYTFLLSVQPSYSPKNRRSLCCTAGKSAQSSVLWCLLNFLPYRQKVEPLFFRSPWFGVHPSVCLFVCLSRLFVTLIERAAQTQHDSLGSSTRRGQRTIRRIDIPVYVSKAPSTPVTMSKQHCLLLRHCCWCGRGLSGRWRSFMRQSVTL